jgi:expansin (peptidoglycan-binding protein)
MSSLTHNMWVALQGLRRGQIDLHWKTAEGLVSRKLAKRVKVLPSGRWVCEITKKGKDYGAYYPKT